MQKKRILIFSSNGGGGHTSARDALYAYLEDIYDVNTAHSLDEVFGKIDPIKFLTFNYCNGEQFYNYCLHKKWTKLANILYHFGLLMLRIKRAPIQLLLDEYIKEKKPNLVISIVPIINGVLEQSCQKLHIPFLLIPTDLDITTFINSMKSNTEQQVKIALAFNDSSIVAALNKAKIPTHQRCLTGFPLKPSFFSTKNKAQIKKDFAVPDYKPVILLLMGATGSQASYIFMQQIVKLSFPCHILICLGRNEALRKTLELITLPGHISISIISHTDRIADLMAIATLCITKSGTVSVCESLYQQVPMILDATSEPLLWEKFNHSFIQRHGFGEVIRNYTELLNAIERILLHTSYANTIRKNLAGFEKINFGDRIRNIVETMMQQ